MCETSEILDYNDEIVAINYIGIEETIDINTNGNRLFWSNGILTHNSSFDETEFTGASIAGGLSKLNTADILFGIFTSRMMKERGAIQLQFMKTRNSGGVDSKVDLDFDVNSLRITDSSKPTDQNSAMTGSNVLAKIKNRQKTDEVTIGGVTDNRKDLLKSLLGNIKANG
jgi:hypothetical protein